MLARLKRSSTKAILTRTPKSAVPAEQALALSFEDALRELESIVANMEDGSLSLDQSLAAYRRGAELVRHCESALAAAKDQVRVLDGELLRPAGDLLAAPEDRG